jgi:uncharacterized membrane protein
MKDAISILRYFLSYLILSVATFLMLHMIVDYASFDDKTHFLAFKQEYVHLPLWRTAFYTHVFSSILALAAGFTQFNEQVLREHRRLHRWIGRIYAYDILVVNFPAGMILAIYANGLLPSKTAFVILDCLWFLFTLMAVRAAKEGRFKQHREFMIRSYALTFSAITLRTWKIILSHTIHPDPLHLYMMDAWMGFVPNLLFAEWLIRSKARRLYRSKAVLRNL